MREWSTLRKLMLTKGATGIPLTEYTATGNPLTFQTNKSKPLVSLTVPFTPVQSGSGNPSPTNVRPITGFEGVNVWQTGVNLYNKSMEYTNGYYLNDQGEEVYNANWRITEYIPVYGRRFTLSNVGGTNPSIVLYDQSKTKIVAKKYGTSGADKKTNVTLTANEDVYFVRFSVNNATGWADDIQLEYGESASTYTPYVCASYPVTFPALGKNLITGTEYSGSFYNVSSGTDLAKSSSNTSFSENNNVITVTTTSGWNGCVFATGLLKAGTYNVHTEIGSGDVKRSCYVTDSDLIVKSRTALTADNVSITLTEASRIVVFIGINPAGSGTVTNLQVENGSSYTSWEPYTTTAYGGSLNLTTGVLTVNSISVSAKWSAFGNSSDLTDVTRRTYSVSDLFTTDTSSTGKYCNVATHKNSYSDNSVHFYVANVDGSGRLYVFLPKNTDGDTVVQVVAPLGTAKTYQLTPAQIQTLIGDNTIWSDTNGSNTAVYLKKG